MEREEFEYRSHGTAVFLALPRRGQPTRVPQQQWERTGIVPFQRLLEAVVREEPYRSATRLFFVVDNGAHSRQPFQARLAEWFPQPDYREMIAVRLPKHASWLNQAELFFSLVGRKAPPHLECRDRATMAEHLDRFVACKHPHPFHWRSTKEDLAERLKHWPSPTANKESLHLIETTRIRASTPSVRHSPRNGRGTF